MRGTCADFRRGQCDSVVGGATYIPQTLGRKRVAPAPQHRWRGTVLRPRHAPMVTYLVKAGRGSTSRNPTLRFLVGRTGGPHRGAPPGGRSTLGGTRPVRVLAISAHTWALLWHCWPTKKTQLISSACPTAGLNCWDGGRTAGSRVPELAFPGRGESAASTSPAGSSSGRQQ